MKTRLTWKSCLLVDAAKNDASCPRPISRRSSNVARARFSAAGAVGFTLEFCKCDYIEGLFLSSGIIRSPDRQVMREGGAAFVANLKAATELVQSSCKAV